MIDLELDERLFQSFTVTFGIRADDPKAEYLAEDVMMEFSGDRFFVTDVIGQRNDIQAIHSVVGEAGWMRLADLRRPGSTKIEGLTPSAGLAQILLTTPWTVDQVTASAVTYSMEAMDATVLDLLWQWAKVTGCEIQFNSMNRSLVFIEAIGAHKGVGFRYGRNLTTIKRTATAPRVTRLYAYGRNGIDISSWNGGVPYLEDYSFYTSQGYTLDEVRENYRKDEIWADDSFIETEALYQAALARLALLSQPTLLYEASVADLSEILGLSDYDFRCGDYVWVYDEILNINLEARVTRRVVYPNEPQRNKIELSFAPVLIPDPNASSSRANTAKGWELFESRNLTPRQVRQGSMILHRLVLDVVEGAEWVSGFKLQGVAEGASDFTVEVTNDTDDSVVWETFVDTLVDGQKLQHNFTFGQKNIPTGEYIMTVRAFSDTPGAGLDIASGGTAYWYLARGTTRDNVVLANSQRFDFTGAIQTFTIPDDVHVINVEVVGAAGASKNGGTPGWGGKLISKFYVVPGSTFDVYVGGCENFATTGGWPNGGNAIVSSGSSAGGPGGGASFIIPTLQALTEAWIVAPGGGGSGWFPLAQNDPTGGFGGFLTGQNGDPSDIGTGGQGATQLAGGIAGVTGFSGEAGTFMQGGAGRNAYLLAYGGGGGGGGWYGGGGGGGAGDACSGGGGGSGFLIPDGFDLEIIDGANDTDGYIIFSWEAPETP